MTQILTVAIADLNITSDREKYLLGGSDEVLVKPTKPKQIVETIQQLLAAK
ncbi:hypothetical protein [Tumidithrix helvetica]|uniref:hypothetical protein n=1 Tax=Tumidithrix helvetica TaxID=3457545 RepID=UPI003CC5BA72